MIPAQAATQKIRRPATCRSYSGLVARRCRMTNTTAAATAIAARPSARVPLFGTGAKLIAKISVPTITTDRTPPRLSTGSVVSFTWLGTKMTASSRAMPASGSVIRKTDPHQNFSSSAPPTRGPSAAIPPPIADHSAIDFVRPGPDHSAAIRASVVGYAMPAEIPPSTRAANNTMSVGA
jgi:hypothetical protein